VRPGFCARARCRPGCCAGGHNIVNQHNLMAGDCGVGEESIMCVSKAALFVQAMLGSALVTIP